MKLIALFIMIVAFTSCKSTDVLDKAETYSNVRGFQPIDPIDYTERIKISKNGEMVGKYPIDLSKDEILDFLKNETVLVSIGQLNIDGTISYGPVRLSAKRQTYKITMDYMKFATVVELDKNQTEIIGHKRVGIGLRLIINIVATDAGVNLGDLFAIGLAAKNNQVSGTLMMEVIGIKSKDVTNILPLPSEINQTTIQTAMQVMATIKSKVYDSELYPQVMAIKSETKGNEDKLKTQVEQQSLK